MGSDILAMEADWTRPDDGIAAYLASFGRYGIPFNAVYGPGAPGRHRSSGIAQRGRGVGGAGQSQETVLSGPVGDLDL